MRHQWASKHWVNQWLLITCVVHVHAVWILWIDGTCWDRCVTTLEILNIWVKWMALLMCYLFSLVFLNECHYISFGIIPPQSDFDWVGWWDWIPHFWASVAPGPGASRPLQSLTLQGTNAQATYMYRDLQKKKISKNYWPQHADLWTMYHKKLWTENCRN